MRPILARYHELLKSQHELFVHMPALFWIAAGRTVIDIGFRDGVGFSATAWLAGGCKSLLAVDIEERKVPAEIAEMPNFRILKADSKTLQGHTADIVMIDGDHSYEGALADLENWNSKARETLVLHDTCDKKLPGVRKALNEFLDASKDWRVAYESPHCHGLTILKRT